MNARTRTILARQAAERVAGRLPVLRAVVVTTATGVEGTTGPVDVRVPGRTEILPEVWCGEQQTLRQGQVALAVDGRLPFLAGGQSPYRMID